MWRPRLEVADVFRAQDESFWGALEPRLSSEQRRVVGAISACRTAALGGHVDAYGPCGHLAVSYNSCRDRHCPKCQGAERERWLAERTKDLLPVAYFHVVFTVPEQVAEIALRNKREVYAILFKAASDALRIVAADPRHLGAEVGVLAVLHTWGQTLVHHPHLHCVIPGGGLSPGGAWVGCRETFLLPVRVLSRVFRRRFLEELEAARARGELAWVGRIGRLALAGEWRRLLATLRRVEWVVYAKRPFGGPEQVLEYLGRYTHKVAITNARLLSHEGGRVRFRYRDYRAGDAERVLELEAGEFIRRFLQHVLPRGFQRLRQYGLLANRGRREKLERARRELERRGAGAEPPRVGPSGDAGEEAEPGARGQCPVCGEGRRVSRRELARGEEVEPLVAAAREPARTDSS